LASLLMGLSWTAMGTVVAATIVSDWFEHKRGLALSLTFNGATCGGIVLVPALVVLIRAIGFAPALLAAAAFMVAVMVPVALILIRQPPPQVRSFAAGQNVAPAADAQVATSRWTLLRSFGFWTVTAPFALALTAQIGFLVHQIAILEPSLGPALAALAVSISAAMSLTGRTCLALIVDRLDPRLTSAVSVLTQAAALVTITQTSNVAILFAACAVFGFSIGNLITLPALIIHREFAPAMFATVMGLSIAAGGIINAFGPAIVGLLRDSTGSYTAPLLFCVGLELVAVVIVLFRPRARSS
jgi:cyanate permease